MNACRASAIVAENANETETHRNRLDIASCDEVGVMFGYCWSTVGYGEAGANRTSVAEAERMAGDVEVQCQTSANVNNGSLNYVCSNEGNRLLNVSLSVEQFGEARTNQISLSVEQVNKAETEYFVFPFRGSLAF